MAQILSKEDEKKILSKIVKMVEGISENKDDSYIRIAFEGFEALALNNIEYDMGDSVMTLVEANRKANEEVRVLERQLKEMSKDYENAQAIITTAKEKLDAYWKQLEEAYADKKRTEDNLQGIIDTLDTKIGNMAKALEEVTASKDLEIMKLKAEIYDLKK
jgi:chromosome segregation ATPase